MAVETQELEVFYDEGCVVYEAVWGEHMHSGYFDADNTRDFRVAQIRMLEELLAWAGVPGDDQSRPRNILDVGCGFGGTSRYLSNKYSANVTGIALSEYEIARARAITKAEGVCDKVAFQVADALSLPFEDNQYDLVWCMECADHIADKLKLMQEMTRVAKPGGWVVLTGWCHREFTHGETSLKKHELKILDKIRAAYLLPPWCPTSEYKIIAIDSGLQEVNVEDWTRHMLPFWGLLTAEIFTLRGAFKILTSGWAHLRASISLAYHFSYMDKGFKSGVFKYAVVMGKKDKN
ncbi:hypothetical protein SELMODRAFT_451558 [Selaginella moellendorffii]|uniref:Methyltransferase type 11 domain-containing protein n=1 Tax=Selaginella moellendorffii TaxID=88036 RepID=D8RH05_SELML|nr:probable tocopherol O-methyltransferase, chloroplastic isoform X1 [Selaginella moellendorffii]EFJ28453.1 hypothetical protein SELMODRAFT_451558 [Selaginella moellendorffii]|eukprot:XP_002970323.1 probable tocopherol O-methyltransferase, chloroplastic isoform X1 [Selaginella moellendorffii]